MRKRRNNEIQSQANTAERINMSDVKMSGEERYAGISKSVGARVFLIGVSLVIMECTAYFNTYYNAEVAFKEAFSSHTRLLKNYPDSLVITPPADVATKYDRTIEKTQKAIETFPKAKKWHDDALLLMGKAHFFKKEMEKAIRRFRQLEQEFPQSDRLPEAYLFMGKAYIEDGNLDKAEEILTIAEKRFPDLNRDQQITLLLITIAIRRDGKSQAITLLEKTRRSIRSETLRNDLLLRTAELYIELKQFDKAILLLRKAPRKKDNPLQSYRMDLALLTCYEAIDTLDAALHLIDAMIDQKKYVAHHDEMLFRKGKILSAMGRIEDAIKVYRKLTAGLDSASVPGDTSAFKARALIELALIYQKDREDYRKAQSFLSLAAASRDTGSSRFALQRLSAMERLAKLREREKEVDSVRGYRFLSIGELFMFELDEPDSAFDQFMQIGKDSSTDSSIVPKALCQAARVARDDLHDTLVSDSLFRIIIARYPSSDYAKIGQRELDIPVTAKTRQDSADELYHRAETMFYRDNDVKGAIQLFYDISKKYGDLSIGQKSLFAAAWFSDNVLFKNKTAKMLYEKICSLYPGSEYCTQQAKPRMKIVADTLAKLDQMRKKHEKKPAGRKEEGKKAADGMKSSGNGNLPSVPDPDPDLLNDGESGGGNLDGSEDGIEAASTPQDLEKARFPDPARDTVSDTSRRE